MNDFENISFSSLEEKCQYYITEYQTYKIKFISLKTEYEQLLENNKKLYENINNERKLRKELENKLKFTNFSNGYNCNYNKNKKEERFQDEFVILEKDCDVGEGELLNICDNIKNKDIEMVKNTYFSILSKNKEKNLVFEENKSNKDNKELNNLNLNKDCNKSYQNPNKRTNKELITEELLTQDFIKYSKESVSLGSSIYNIELKIDKIYVYIQKLCQFLKVTKRGANFFNKSIALFNKYLSVYDSENKKILEVWPFLTEFISLVQKSFSSINIYCSALITTIDSSCIIQINDILLKQFQNLINIRNKIKIKKEEFKSFQYNFLSNRYGESMKNQYYKECKEYELAKYDYFSIVNKFFISIKIKIPEILSLLVISYFNYFSSVRDELNQINNTVRKNLESLLGAINIKNKIESDIKNKRKIISDKFQSYDKTKKEKEGFLYLKGKDDYKFHKRYVKINKGNLIYYKIKKGFKPYFQNLENKIFINIIEPVDTETTFDICRLLFSNVKRCEKNYIYPFCFEVNSVNNKSSYIFQAETEYELEEWISAITNTISEQISGFNENKIDNENKDIINNNYIDENNDDELTELKKRNLVTTLIENNICADCGAKNPTWLNINWLILLCMDCSGIHRSLGVQISKIRSLELDNIDIDYIELLFILKQSEINQILEEKIKEFDETKPNFNSSREEKEKFILNKYKNKKYMNLQQNNNEKDIIKDIFENIKDNNLINVFRLIKLNQIDVNSIYLYDNEEWGFVHYSAKLGKLFMIKLFYIIGAEITLNDKKGLKPINYVKVYENTQIYQYLKDKEK